MVKTLYHSNHWQYKSPEKLICHKFQETETLLFSHIAYRFLWRSPTAWSRGDEVLVFSLLQVPTEGPFYLKLEHLLKRRTKKKFSIFYRHFMTVIVLLQWAFFSVLCPLGLFCFVCIETIQLNKMSFKYSVLTYLWTQP